MNIPKSDSDERLSQTLREWVVESPLPPRFQERVWQRIAQTERARPGFAAALASIVQVFGRPRVAIGYVTVLVALGVVTGSWTAHIQRDRVEHDLSARYVQALNPFVVAASDR